jgi:hypothetical protein
MTYVDSAVLDLTEKFCRWFQTWTGRTNVWLAFQLTNLSIVVYFIWAASLYFVSGDLALRVFVALVCGGVFLVLTRTIFRMSIEASEAAAYGRLAKGLRNPRRVAVNRAFLSTLVRVHHSASALPLLHRHAHRPHNDRSLRPRM